MARQPKKPDAKSELTCVTPEMAKEWLEKNSPENRRLNYDRVAALTHDINEGNWKTNGDNIIFGKGDLLVNGQHRLTAIVTANKSVWVWVMHNKQATIHDPMDQNLPRTVAFVAGLSAREASSYAWLYRLEHAMLYTKQRVTNGDITLMQSRYGEMYASLREVEGLKVTQLPATLVAAVMWIMPIDERLSIDFLLKVQAGEMIKRGDPAYAFRNWHKGARLAGVEVVLGSLNALRHHLQGKTLKSVYTTESGYRAACSKRRGLKVEHTPGTDLVGSMAWPVGERPEREKPETAAAAE